MSLIKNPEANPSDQNSSHLRIARITFGAKAPVIAEVSTRLAVHQNIREGFMDRIHAVAVELKRRPTESLAFDVVSEIPNRELAAFHSLRLPMLALRNAGVDLDELVHLHPPTLVSNDRREDPLDNRIDLGLYDDLRDDIDGFMVPDAPHIQTRPALVLVDAEYVTPELAHAV